MRMTICESMLIKIRLGGLVLPVPVNRITISDLGRNECVENTDEVLKSLTQRLVNGWSARRILALETVNRLIGESQDISNVGDAVIGERHELW